MRRGGRRSLPYDFFRRFFGGGGSSGPSSAMSYVDVVPSQFGLCGGSSTTSSSVTRLRRRALGQPLTDFIVTHGRSWLGLRFVSGLRCRLLLRWRRRWRLRFALIDCRRLCEHPQKDQEHPPRPAPRRRNRHRLPARRTAHGPTRVAFFGLERLLTGRAFHSNRHTAFPHPASGRCQPADASNSGAANTTRNPSGADAVRSSCDSPNGSRCTSTSRTDAKQPVSRSFTTWPIRCPSATVSCGSTSRWMSTKYSSPDFRTHSFSTPRTPRDRRRHRPHLVDQRAVRLHVHELARAVAVEPQRREEDRRDDNERGHFVGPHPAAIPPADNRQPDQHGQRSTAHPSDDPRHWRSSPAIPSACRRGPCSDRAIP